MSPLLPRHYFIGLNGGGWIALRRWGRQNRVESLIAPPAPTLGLPDCWSASWSSILATLEKLPRPRGSTATIMLPDDMGHVCALPWQAGVVTIEEVARYGKYYLASRGMVVDHGWCVHAQLAQFGRPGLVFAIQNSLLEKFRTDLSLLQLRVQRVGPVALIDHARRSNGLGRKPKVRIHLGSHSVSALCFDRGGLRSYLHEVGGNSPAATITRMLRRLQLSEDDVLSHATATLVSPAPAALTHITEVASLFTRSIQVEDLRNWSHW